MNSTAKKIAALQGLIIDAHNHVGVNDGLYAGNDIYGENGGHPYCQSIESLYYRQISAGVDVSIVFPFGSHPRSSFPYEIDNRVLLKELYKYHTEHS